jgi:hypothetical protein
VAYVLLAVVVVIGAVVLVLPKFGRNHRLHEVDRFHRAGQITSDWARAGVTQPVLVDDAAPREPDAPAKAPHDDHRRDRATAHQ